MKTILILLPALACGAAFGLKSAGWLRLLCVALLIAVLAWFAVPVMRTHITPQGWQGLSDIDPYGWAAHAVYINGTDPYGKKGWLSFPFPVFPILRAVSRGGALAGPIWKLHFFYLNLALAFLSALFFLTPRLISKKKRAAAWSSAAALMLLYLFTEGTARTLSQGQVNLIVAFFLSLFLSLTLLAVRPARPRTGLLIAAGFCLSLATLTKPIIAPILLYLILRGLVDLFHSRRSGDAASFRLSAPGWIALSAIGSILLVLGLTAAIPGGISGDHYIGFFTKGAAMGSRDFLMRPMNFSPLSMLIRTGLLPEAPGTIAAIMLLLLAALASAGTLSPARPFRPVFLAPWIYATLLWSPISWSHYACWTYGAFLLLLQRMDDRPHDRTRLLFSLTIFLCLGLTQLRASYLYLPGTLLFFLLSCSCLCDPGQDHTSRP
jgi:hypothetical protein